MISALACYSFISAYELRSAARNSDLVFAEAKTWRLGRTSGTAIAAFTEQFGGQRKVKGHCSQECVITLEFLATPPMWVLGNIPRFSHFFYGRYALFAYTFNIKGGRLDGLQFSHWTMLEDQQVRIFSIRGKDDYDPGPDSPRHGKGIYTNRPNLTSPPPGGLVFHVMFTAKVTDPEWEQIMEFNSTCVTRWRQCRRISDYMPFGWSLWVKERQQSGWPHQGVDDLPSR
jgi:hypothetical protein